MQEPIMTSPKVNIVIPLYNEEDVFELLIDRLTTLIEKSKLTIEVIMVDDGSTDSTPWLMKELCLKDSSFNSIFLSRNFGHQLALTAGLKYVNATECVLIIDGDLQDPPELLEKFYSYYMEGYDVVYAVRKNRKEGFFKKLAYKYYYKLQEKLSFIKIPLDSGDFSLISKRVVNELNQMNEESRYIRGMRSWVGFKQIGVVYERDKRQSGETKYPFKKLVSLALNGIFNFSEIPIKLLIRLGLIVITISTMYLIYSIIKRLFFDTGPSGFTALLFVITLFGGIQLVALGVLGEYILRIFFQVKNRPLFIVKEVIFGKEIKHE